MRRLLRFLLCTVLLLAVVFVLPVAALRWLPAPTSAFMLASDTRPVRYQWVAAGQIPAAARRAVVASEDQKFFEHEGFDIEAMQKAYENNQKKGRRVRGASTISQQTAKNLFLWSGGGYLRKGIEAIYTVLIEALWDKQRILTVYLNIAEFGPGIYGVEAASQAFYGKPAAQLGNAEAARLAAVLPSPRKWSAAKPGPYVQKRTAWILGQMGAGPGRATAPEPLPTPQEREAEPLPEDADDVPASSDPPATTHAPPAAPAEPPVPAELQQELERERAERLLDGSSESPQSAAATETPPQ